VIARRIGRIVAVVLVVLVVAPVGVAADEADVGMVVRASPLRVALGISASSVTVGKTFQVKATVTNDGADPASDVRVELRLDPVGLSVHKGSVRTISQVKGGKSASVSWSICATAPGSYVLLAQVDDDGATIESPARIVSVTGTGRRTC
jgi:subtilase family serine protease